jgi:hypothetical protein
MLDPNQSDLGNSTNVMELDEMLVGCNPQSQFVGLSINKENFKAMSSNLQCRALSLLGRLSG